jgi:predicted transcriptional regulator
MPQLKIAQILPQKKAEKEMPEVVINPPEKAEGITQPKVYEETAEPGEGITHLARKALKEYLKEKGGPNLTPEHKIYIEDYLQNKTGDYWLKVGQKLTFSEELIKEAIEKAQTLTQQQLQNLSQYAKLVPELNY